MRLTAAKSRLPKFNKSYHCIKMGTTALIDGDIIVYRCGFSAEHTLYTLRWEHEDGNVEETEFQYKRDLNKFVKDNDIEEYEIDKTREVEPLENALHSAKHTMSTILEDTGADNYRVFLTTGDNFRHERATIQKYKGNRDNQPRPVHYQDIRDYLLTVYNAEDCKGIEADDALADAQTEDTVICSIDKDLLQVPGKHYNWVTKRKKLVSPEVGLRTLWCQVLTGDETDNIPGIKGIGEITAKKILDGCETEDEYREMCLQEWRKYLEERSPEWLQSVEVDEEDNLIVHYEHWKGTRYALDMSYIVDEVLNLVKVGVN